MHEPEPVAADLGHVRVDRGDGCRHRHHGLERVAARSQGGAPRLDGGVMRGGDDALAMSGGVEVHRWARDRSDAVMFRASGASSNHRYPLEARLNVLRILDRPPARAMTA